MEAIKSVIEKIEDDWFKKEDLHPDLVPYLIEEGITGKMIHHPLVISIIHADVLNRVVNRQYVSKKIAIQESLQERKWSSYIFLHERAYRLDAFRNLVNRGDIETGSADYWQLFSTIWQDSENIHQFLDEWIELWSAKDLHLYRHLIMNDDEIAIFNELPDTFPIWRGASHKRVHHGLSWSTNKMKAEWFARRFAQSHKSCYLACGIAQKRDVVAYFGGRNENEVVILPDNISNISVKKLAKKYK